LLRNITFRRTQDGTFELYIGNDKQYWFRLKAGNSEIIGKSEG
jgi:uncharacterized protein YegP (UPF0339 family)